MLEREEGRAEERLDSGAPPRRGRLRRLLRIAGITLVLSGALFVGGFLYFADAVTALAPPADIKADAIVVLTGGSQRLNQAIELLSRGAGERLLISGVHPNTTRNQLRRLTQGTNSMFRCCVDIGYEALDTIGNATEAIDWIHRRGYRRVLVVTNNYHMPRSLAELERTDHGTRFIAYPVETDVSPDELVRNPLLIRTLAAEYVKFLLVVSRDWTGISV